MHDDFPLKVCGVSYFSRLSLGLNLTRKGKYRNSVTKDGAPLLPHLRPLAVAAIGPDRQILHPLDPVGEGGRADADAQVIGPQLLAALGVEGHDVTVHFARKYEVA